MTEVEALALIPAYVDVAVTSFSIYLTLTFAYFTVAYLAGAQLTSFQAFAISSLYLVGSGSALLCALINIQAWGKIKEQYTTTLDEFIFWNADLWLAYMPTMMTVGVCLGLYFMWNIRHGGTNDS